jgi:hypothetical protein
MKTGLFNILLFTLMVAITCCDDSLHLNIPDPDDKIVIDGWIENGQYAKVLLTANTPYFSSLDSSSIRNLVLTKAKVTLSSEDRSEILILRRNENYFPSYIFEGNEIKGDTGKIYTITAEYGGKKAFGTTTIPANVRLDTLYFLKKEHSDSLGTIYVEFTDPSETRNYYRVLTQVSGNDRRFLSSMIMGISDVFFSGQKFGFSLYRGQKSYISSAKNEYFTLGDTVGIKFCTIDKAHYEFWNTFQDEILNTGNPFASSLSVIKSNIQGDGLGIWGGYGVSYYTLIIR